MKPILLMLVFLTGCAKAGRIAMSMEPNHQAIVVIEGRRPQVRIDTIPRDDPAQLEVQRLSSPSAKPETHFIGTYQATLTGPTRFTIINTTDERVLVEIKSKGHSGLIIDQAPAPGGSQ